MPKHIVAYPPVDFSVPFEQLSNRDIDIYFHYDNRVGKPTCKAACAHCYFLNQPTFHIPFSKAVEITANLAEQGYNIGMVAADSFGDEAMINDRAGSAFRLRSLGTSAWSSGVPLFLSGWESRLDRAWAVGYRSIIITAHEAAGGQVPFEGVTKPRVIEGAIANIHTWNARNAPSAFAVSCTVTIGRHNNSLEHMRRMVRWAVDRNLDVLRFNCFANFRDLEEHRDLEMSREDIELFFSHMARLQEEFLETPTALGISEDWGDAGIEQIYPHLPEVWQSRTAGWCRAGYRLFAMVEIEGRISLVGCVDKWEPVVGYLIDSGNDLYRIDWNYERIDTIRRSVLEEKVYACWGGVGCDRSNSAGFNASGSAERTIFEGVPSYPRNRTSVLVAELGA